MNYPVCYMHQSRTWSGIADLGGGKGEIPVDDTHALGLYNAPRTIVDAFRLRREVGPGARQ